MVTPSPNPAAFDGHWLGRAAMARLLGIEPRYFDRLIRKGLVPADAIKWTGGGGYSRARRRYDAGKVLAARQQERR